MKLSPPPVAEDPPRDDMQLHVLNVFVTCSEVSAVEALPSFWHIKWIR